MTKQELIEENAWLKKRVEALEKALGEQSRLCPHEITYGPNPLKDDRVYWKDKIWGLALEKALDNRYV